MCNEVNNYNIGNSNSKRLHSLYNCREGFMDYAVEKASGGTIYMLKFMMIGSSIEVTLRSGPCHSSSG
jgi:hypothetical protein